MRLTPRVLALLGVVARFAPTGAYVEVNGALAGIPPEGPWQGNHLKDHRDDGTCCQGVPDCGGVSAENTGGWGHVARDYRFSTPYNNTLNTSTLKYTPRPYALDITGGYVFNQTYYEHMFIYAATGSTGQGLRTILRDCATCSPYWQTTGLWTGRRSDPALAALAAKMPTATPLSHDSRRNILMHVIGKTNLANRRLLSSNSTAPAPPQVSAEVKLGGLSVAQFDTTEQTYFRTRVAARMLSLCGNVSLPSPRACTYEDVILSNITNPVRRVDYVSVAFHLLAHSESGSIALQSHLNTYMNHANFTVDLQGSSGALQNLVSILVTQSAVATYPTPTPTPAPTPAPTPVGYVALPVWTEEAGPDYFPVASYYVVPRNGNVLRKHHGFHIPKCHQQDAIPPTRLPPVAYPSVEDLVDGQGGTDLIPPAPPVPNTMICWDGTVCPGRSAQVGIQCCSAPVMAGDTCAQIFICDQRRTCTGPRACYQQFDSLWDVNNNGWQLAGIVTFIGVMSLFLCLFLTYCCCDRCIINRRKYAAQRERKRYLSALPSLSSMDAQA